MKGDARMARVLAKAVHDRERPLREDLVVPFGVTTLRLTVADSDRIVKAARRRFRRHNAARRFVEAEVFAALAASSRIETTPDEVRDRTRHLDEVREALERMWPVLTPAELLHDLFGSRALLRLAASKWLADDEWMAPAPPAHADGQRGRLVRGRRRPARRGPRAARAPGQPQRQRRGGARSGPTATSSWTRCRTSRPCSCGWWPAGR